MNRETKPPETIEQMAARHAVERAAMLASQPLPKGEAPKWLGGVVAGAIVLGGLALYSQWQNKPVAQQAQTAPQASPIPEPETVSPWLPMMRPDLVGYARMAVMAVDCDRLPKNITSGLVAGSFRKRAEELDSQADRAYASIAMLDGGADGRIAVQNDRAAACGALETDKMLDAVDKVLGNSPMWPRP